MPFFFMKSIELGASRNEKFLSEHEYLIARGLTFREFNTSYWREKSMEVNVFKRVVLFVLMNVLVMTVVTILASVLGIGFGGGSYGCLLYTSPSPRD